MITSGINLEEITKVAKRIQNIKTQIDELQKDFEKLLKVEREKENDEWNDFWDNDK